MVELLKKKNIDCRPIVTGNFLKNTEVLKHFNYEVGGGVANAEYIDKHGLFVGNHHVDISKNIEYLNSIIR